MSSAHGPDSPPGPTHGAHAAVAASADAIPLGQRLYDNVFLLLVVGILIMIAVYTGWGMWEIATMPQGTLP